MELHINYYSILNVERNATEKEIKKSYYDLSKENHPDKGGDPDEFGKINNAYKVLISKVSRAEYDLKSKWGANYDENTEFLNYEFSNDSLTWDAEKLETFKKNTILNIIEEVDDSFNGSLSYKRWVLCKSCSGSGKDTKSNISIKGTDKDGNETISYFTSDDGCDFCEGSGKDWRGNVCHFCFGDGKIGMRDCDTCKGEKRIMGMQKVSNLKFERNQTELKVEFMGHFSKSDPGKVGHLILIKKSK